VGSILLVLMRRASVVGLACLAQLVNAIAPIMTVAGGPAWRQTTYFPFRDAARAADGAVLRAALAGPVYDTGERTAVPCVDAVAVREADGTLTVFAVNRSLTDAVPLALDLGGVGGVETLWWRCLSGGDAQARNGPGQETIASRPAGTVALQAGRGAVELPPLSWNVFSERPDGREA
jgi:alpha-N-arabinofuranosidase